MIARKAVVAAAILSFGTLTSPAHATPPWVDRLLTLPGPVAGTIDLGGSFAHADVGLGPTNPPDNPPCGFCGFNGTGVNIEGVLGIASRVDIGLRVGIRGFNDNLPTSINEGAITQADSYARPFDQIAFYGGNQHNNVYGDGAVSNPELRVRGRILNVRGVFELGVEGRLIAPFANGTALTHVVGVPMALHIRRTMRFDFGAYSHFTFANDFNGHVVGTLELPAAFWFQVHPRVFLGPMFAFRFYTDNVYSSGPQNYDISLGFGVGVSLARYIELKAQIVFPRIDDGARYVGTGAAVSFYFH